MLSTRFKYLRSQLPWQLFTTNITNPIFLSLPWLVAAKSFISKILLRRWGTTYLSLSSQRRKQRSGPSWSSLRASPLIKTREMMPRSRAKRMMLQRWNLFWKNYTTWDRVSQRKDWVICPLDYWHSRARLNNISSSMKTMSSWQCQMSPKVNDFATRIS